MESPAASRVNFLHDHAIISDASYNAIMSSCYAVPADFNTRSDCRELRYIKPVGDALADCSYERRGETRVRGPYNVSGCSNASGYASYYCDGDGGSPYLLRAIHLRSISLNLLLFLGLCMTWIFPGE